MRTSATNPCIYQKNVVPLHAKKSGAWVDTGETL